MNEIMTIGIDLAKNLFALYGVDAAGKPVFRKSGKNDFNGAEAICEATTRPHMCFVAVKTEAQQSASHRSTKCAGISWNSALSYPKELPTSPRDSLEVLQEENLPLDAVEVLAELRGHLLVLEERLAKYDRIIARMAKDEVTKRLTGIPGVGPLTATVVVATVGDAKLFRNGRELAAWMGLVPRQNSSGGKSRLGRITKQGDSYLRSLFLQGAMIVIRHLGEKVDSRSVWIRSQEILFSILNTLQLRSDNLTRNQSHAHLFGTLGQLP
ncbi:MAG: IS110 family RNA-guided transposase [Acidithiobacillus sp.]